MTDRMAPSASARLQRAIIAVLTVVLLLLGTGFALAGGVWPSTSEPLMAGIHAPLADHPAPILASPRARETEPKPSDHGEPAKAIAPSDPQEQASHRDDDPPAGGAARQPSAKPQGSRPTSARPDDGADDRASEREDDEHETVESEVRDDEHEEDD